MNPLTPFAAVAAVAAGIYGLYLIWTYGLCPVWRTMMAINHFAEALPVLLEIADEFKPNGGGSLRDQIDEIRIGQINIEQQLEQICTGAPCQET